jgi:hypothetical protein
MLNHKPTNQSSSIRRRRPEWQSERTVPFVAPIGFIDVARSKSSSSSGESNNDEVDAVVGVVKLLVSTVWQIANRK